MSTPDIGDLLSGGGISSLLQNPEVAAKLPRIMEALAPLMAEMKAEAAGGAGASASGDDAPSAADAGAEGSAPADVPAGADAAANADAVAALASLPGKTRPFRADSSKRHALLKALAPYLSDNRRETLEFIVKVSSLIDLLSDVL